MSTFGQTFTFDVSSPGAAYAQLQAFIEGYQPPGFAVPAYTLLENSDPSKVYRTDGDISIDGLPRCAGYFRIAPFNDGSDLQFTAYQAHHPTNGSWSIRPQTVTLPAGGVPAWRCRGRLNEYGLVAVFTPLGGPTTQSQVIGFGVANRLFGRNWLALGEPSDNQAGVCFATSDYATEVLAVDRDMTNAYEVGQLVWVIGQHGAAPTDAPSSSVSIRKVNSVNPGAITLDPTGDVSIGSIIGSDPSPNYVFTNSTLAGNSNTVGAFFCQNTLGNDGTGLEHQLKSESTPVLWGPNAPNTGGIRTMVRACFTDVPIDAGFVGTSGNTRGYCEHAAFLPEGNFSEGSLHDGVLVRTNLDDRNVYWAFPKILSTSRTGEGIVIDEGMRFCIGPGAFGPDDLP